VFSAHGKNDIISIAHTPGPVLWPGPLFHSQKEMEETEHQQTTGDATTRVANFLIWK